MTDIERAIKHFENVRDGAMVVLDSFGHKPNENPSLYKRRKLNAELAISALEKQIPKKPILDVIFPSGVEWYLCPVCNHNGIEKVGCYCHNCGQALDWGDSNGN